MTLRNTLQRTARLRLLSQYVPFVPALIACAVALIGRGRSDEVVLWCSQHWWILFLLAGVASFALTILLSFRLRCPFCHYRFRHIEITELAFPSKNSPIRFCSHCGKAFDAEVSVAETQRRANVNP